jgi:hypothetical protein
MGSANIRNFEKGRANGGETGCDTAAWTRGRKKPSFSIIAVLSGGDGLEFSGSVFGEIGGGRSFEAQFAVDGGVDLGGRKNEPVFLWLILQASHFTEFQERGGLLHGGFLLGFAVGLEGLQHGEVLLNGPVDALLVKGEELELFGFQGEDAGGGEGGVDLGVTGLVVIGQENAAVFVETKGEEVVLNGAGSPTTAVALRQQITGIRLGRFINVDHASCRWRCAGRVGSPWLPRARGWR